MNFNSYPQDSDKINKTTQKGVSCQQWDVQQGDTETMKQ